MKKLCVLSLLLILSAINIFSQSGWYRIGNLNSGLTDFEDLSVVNNNVAFAHYRGNGSPVVRTTNGGFSWEVIYQTSNLLFSIYMVDTKVGFIGGRDLLLRTSNGGNNWSPINFSFEGDQDCMSFLNLNTGYVGSFSGGVIKTTNSGFNWHYAGYFSDPVETIYFINENTGFVGTILDVRIYKTTDGGGSWTAKYSAGSSASVNSILFVDNITGYACGHVFGSGNIGRVLKTTNTGESWVPLITNTSAVISIDFIDPNTGYGVCDGVGVIIKTSNGGVNWFPQNSHTSNHLYKIAFSSADNGFIGGDGLGTSIILQTTNGGINWLASTYGIVNDYNDVVFVDNNTGYVLGDNGKMLKTTNAGTEWMYIYTQSNNALQDINFKNQLTGIGVGDNGFIIKTSDGNTWIHKNSNTTFNLRSVSFINNSLIIAVGDNGTMISSTNEGDNWQTMSSLTNDNLNDINCIYNSNKIFIAGNNGTIFYSSNNGVTFNQQNSQVNTNLNSVFSYDSNSIYIVGDNGIALKTVNTGNVWLNQNMIPSYDLYGVISASQTIQYAVGNSGGIFKSTNSGDNWINQTSATNFTLSSIWFTSLNTGYTVGNGGRIFKTTSGGGQFMGISPYQGEIPSFFSLSQNYPNPFNPVTKIKFEIPLSRGVSEGRGVSTKIIIYDLLGREVATLVNEQLKPGTYEVEWDGSGYASGVYFYSLVSEDFVETKRMVLIK